MQRQIIFPALCVATFVATLAGSFWLSPIGQSQMHHDTAGQSSDPRPTTAPSTSVEQSAEKSPAKTSPAKAMAHDHKTIAIPDGQPLPKIKLRITPDAIAGWNMQVQTENFVFAPERLNQTSNPAEGHAHLFLNGRKVARLYGPWSHIPKLPQGKNELKVTLNTNMHEDLTHQGKTIAATAIVEVP